MGYFTQLITDLQNFRITIHSLTLHFCFKQGPHEFKNHTKSTELSPNRTENQYHARHKSLETHK